MQVKAPAPSGRSYWLHWLTYASLAVQFIKGDLQSGDLLGYILKTEQIDTVMHFAAQVILNRKHLLPCCLAKPRLRVQISHVPCCHFGCFGSPVHKP